MIFGLDSFNGLAYGQILGQGNEIRHHDTAGGIIVIFEKPLDLFGPLLFHLFQDGVRFFIRQTTDQVGHVIRRHLFQNFNDIFKLQFIGQGDKGVLIQFAEEDAFFLRILDHVQEL